MTLAELRALSERATKGPWTWNDWSQDDGPDRTTLQAVVPFKDDFERRLWAQTSPHGRPARIVGCDDCDGEASAADRELIAAARTWLPALIEVAALSKELSDPLVLARRFHEAYEWLAPSFGYRTRPESAKPWEEVPEQNRALMEAVCQELMTRLRAALARLDEVGRSSSESRQ